MADGHMTWKLFKAGFREDLRNQPHVFMNKNLFSVGRDDSRTLLASVLQGVEAEIGQFGCICMVENSANTAFMFRASGWIGQIRAL